MSLSVNVSLNASHHRIKEVETQKYQPNKMHPMGISNDKRLSRQNWPSCHMKNWTCTMFSFTIHSNRLQFIVVGYNEEHSLARILRIDRVKAGIPEGLEFIEDSKVYPVSDISSFLDNLSETTKVQGGLSKIANAFAILGFIRFTSGYYMSIATKRSIVALLGGHYIYHIDETKLIPLMTDAEQKKYGKLNEEQRYYNIFQNIDLSKTFYFSYSYNITQTLQSNLALKHSQQFLIDGIRHTRSMFIWNHHLTKPIYKSLGANQWCTPIVHGYIDQSKISFYGRSVYVTIIARRSRYFAGARFLKRGVNDQGYVANDVETEQIVSELVTTSFDLGNDLFGNPKYTSYVQHRGSIPLYWAQEATQISAKPPIELKLIDPFFTAAARHFDHMFQRYGAPITVLNVIKTKEKIPRETILLREFEQCIVYLNQFLPKGRKIHYIGWDMARAAKSGKNQEVILELERIAESVLSSTGFFHNGREKLHTTKIRGRRSLQQGICRTNCIDCLDRTNACQFVIAKKALGYQLYALGIIGQPNIDFDTDAVDLLTEMYQDHGDTIALQYGGSHLVNTMATYRRINQWESHSRDLIENIRRFYSNSFFDAQRQEAINLFLGNYMIVEGGLPLWDLPNDYHLHHTDPLLIPKKSYIVWWMDDNISASSTTFQYKIGGCEDQFLFPTYWNEYYRPHRLSSLNTIFSYNINSTYRYLDHSSDNWVIGISPFRVRKTAQRKESIASIKHVSAPTPVSANTSKISLYRWLGHSMVSSEESRDSSIHSNDDQVLSPETSTNDLIATSTKAHKFGSLLSKTLPLSQLLENLSEPVVSQEELGEYKRYLEHPASLANYALSSNPHHPVYSLYVGGDTSNAIKIEDHIIYNQHVSLAKINP